MNMTVVKLHFLSIGKHACHIDFKCWSYYCAHNDAFILIFS